MTTAPDPASDASTAAWTERYLNFLGLEREAPSHDALGRILRAHRTVTFENITSILRRAAHPDGPASALCSRPTT